MRRDTSPQTRSDTTIAVKPTFPNEELRVVATQFRGQDYIHIRRYYRDGNAWKPGKGAAFRVLLLPWVMNALRVAEAELLKAGRLLPEDYENDGLNPPEAA